MWYREPNCWPIWSGPIAVLEGAACRTPPADSGKPVVSNASDVEGRPVVSAADPAPDCGLGGRGGAEKIVSALSPGTGVSTPVSTEEGSTVLQAGQRSPLSDTSPPQFGHLITKLRPRVDSQIGSRC